jgi:hypothetical protein
MYLKSQNWKKYLTSEIGLTDFKAHSTASTNFSW